MNYEFGIMSSKYTMEAMNDQTAEIAMCVFLRTPAPIVIYSQHRTIFPNDIMDEVDIMIITEEERQAILNAMHTIKSVELG